VTSLSFAANPKSALNKSRDILVVAPAHALSKGASKWIDRVLGKRHGKTLRDLGRDLRPGSRGAVASSLAWGNAWLRLGVLPNEVSRYNSAARADAIRNVVATAGLRSKGKCTVVLVLDEASHLLPAANAVGRALPLFSRKKDAPTRRVQMVAIDAEGAEIKADTVVHDTVRIARECAALVDTPPTELDPAGFATVAHEVLDGLSGVKVHEYAGEDLVTRGLMGIHSVGRAAKSAPRMIVATYSPKGAKRHVALVGKGVTFDTGGLHLKPRGGMEGMKADMGGAAAVLGAFRVLVAAQCRHAVSLVLCLAENANDADSYKPDDILTMHSGKTVEINNTDAEGRLLLADGVSWAARELKADVVIDAATLTGAQLVSTGTLHAAIVSDDAELEAAAIAAGHESGDLTHPLIFAPELFQREFASPVADMRNSVANRMNAQSSCAAQFVYSHLSAAPGKRRWCHIDLAGPAFPKDRATGYGVALISRLVEMID
jgi:probable aminopeptidase NPEPL1